MTVYEVKFPAGFDVADAVLVPPVPGLDGKWYFSVYGKVNKDAPALTYLCRWSLGMSEVEFVPIETYTHMRGAPAVGMNGAHLWLWSFDTGKRLLVQSIPDWQPPLWMAPPAAGVSAARIESLERIVTSQQMRLSALETELSALRTLLRSA